MEKMFEKILYTSRWLLAPIFIGLSFVLIALLIEFFQSITGLLFNLSSMSETDVTLKVLTLVDIALVGGMIVMVMYAGYENFVSRIDLDEDSKKLSWLGKMDASSLKAKVAASIVAISSIHLLKIFMNLDNIPANKIMWAVVIHLTFVASAFIMGMLDLLLNKKKNGLDSPL